MRRIALPAVLLFCVLAAIIFSIPGPATLPDQSPASQKIVTMSKAALFDRIKGGWAGQVIGCTFGGPTEFRFQSTFIPDHQPIPWSRDAVKRYFENAPGLYDDVYMDLTFVEVLEKEGMDAPAKSFAAKFAAAGYPLWHANQMARYNILHEIEPPQSGHWLNNPHADDIDFQIEADFAGLMTPGMVNAAAGICDRVGHIMNYGDGYYGGLYIASMYSLAFIEKDITRLVEGALRVIPPQSAYAQTIRTVVHGHRDNPEDWKDTWLEVQKKWGRDVGCPEGVFSPFNIDAKVNSAWVVMGLLYGNKDFGQTLSISARCGDDSDCNPATAGGILGTMIGYEKIPEVWKQGLADIEALDFKYTEISLAEAYDLSFRQALEMIRRNGGTAEGDHVRIKIQEPKVVPFEAGFEGHYPVERRRLDVVLNEASPEAEFTFEGIGFALDGAPMFLAGDKEAETKRNEIAIRLAAEIDGGPGETVDLPLNDRIRRPTLLWRYQLSPGRHRVRLKLQDSDPQKAVKLAEVVIYGNRPAATGLFK